MVVYFQGCYIQSIAFCGNINFARVQSCDVTDTHTANSYSSQINWVSLFTAEVFFLTLHKCDIFF